MPKQKLTFEGIVDPASGTSAFLNNEYGFTWSGTKATETPDGVDSRTGSGTAVALEFGNFISFGRFDGPTFNFRKGTFIDYGADDSAFTPIIRGFLDGVKVAEGFVFLDGTDAPQRVRFGADFRGVDQVQIIMGWANSVAVDDLVVNVPRDWIA